MKYFDAHCHVQFDLFDEDRGRLFENLAENEVGGIVVGVDRKSSEQAIVLVESRPDFYASVGLHPNDTPEERFDETAFRSLAAHPKVVSIGECGLDYFRPVDTSDEAKKKQRAVFESHVVLAAETGKPLMIHARPSKGTVDAYSDLIDILESAKREHGDRLTGNVHFFVGGIEEARKLFALDFTTSYTAVLTFTHDYDEVVRAAPLTHLLSETDSPYVAPSSRRGKRNDPLAVMDVVSAIARIRGEEVETVREALLINARRIFKLA
ncbi:MAG: TatD family hydrolase [bacterium]